MSPFRRVLSNALVLCLAATAFGVHAARAQFYDPALRSLNIVSEVGRSPRLLGMGGLTLVIPDRDNHISLWDFADSPLGAFAEDSVGTFELRPSTGSAASTHGMPYGIGERQDLGGRTANLEFESFYRDHKSAAYGAVGRINSLRLDTPYSDDLERRRSIGLPEVMPVFNGRIPRLGGGKLRYGLRMLFGGEHLIDQYRMIKTNPNGEYITLDGETVPAPVYFTPDEYRVNTTGLGGGFSYPLGGGTIVALGLDAIQHSIKGANNTNRSSAEQREERPYMIGQATVIGRPTPSLEYGLDGRAWKSASEASWYFTISAGVGAEPLSGRGKLREREEEGSSLKSRVRYHSGNAELGAGLWTRATKVTVTPPAIDDLTSFNHFLNVVYHRQNADTLALPDSIVANEIRDYAWGYSLGASYKTEKSIFGAEWHWSRDLTEQTYAGSGPEAIVWDIRSGWEYACTEIISGRLGYSYQWWDGDDFTRQNEFKGNSASVGLGLHPAGTRWSFESGYKFAWHQSDFGDPTSKHGTRQQLAAQVHWTF